jgi:hypothetical protein
MRLNLSLEWAFSAAFIPPNSRNFGYVLKITRRAKFRAKKVFDHFAVSHVIATKGVTLAVKSAKL